VVAMSNTVNRTYILFFIYDSFLIFWITPVIR